MNTSGTELRTVLTPVFVLFGSLGLVIVAVMFLRDRDTSVDDLIFVSTGGTNSATPSSDNQPTEAATWQLFDAETQLVENMEYFDSRFERFTAELRLEEEKALGRSDLVGTRYQLEAFQENLLTLRSLTAEWEDETEELMSGDVGRQIAANTKLLDDFEQLHGETRLSVRDVAEMTDTLAPLADFVAMLEQQDKVPYEPSERFKLRVSSLGTNVARSVFEYRGTLAELRRIQRSAEGRPVGEEPLQDAVYRLRRARSRKAEAETAAKAAASATDPVFAGSYSPTPYVDDSSFQTAAARFNQLADSNGATPTASVPPGRLTMMDPAGDSGHAVEAPGQTPMTDPDESIFRYAPGSRLYHFDVDSQTDRIVVPYGHCTSR